MTTIAPPFTARRSDYPDSDGEPMAETDLHVDEILALIAMLKERYRNAQDVYVAGNNFIYYEEGDPTARFSPDVYIVFGTPKRQRRTYRLWEEGRPPTVVIEVTSRKTRLEDAGNKKILCAQLGVAEYFTYDPAGEYLRPPLQGFHLEADEYRPIKADSEGKLLSKALGVKMYLDGGLLNLADAATGERLLRTDEVQQALREAEAELEKLRAELKRLKGQ